MQKMKQHSQQKDSTSVELANLIQVSEKNDSSAHHAHGIVEDPLAGKAEHRQRTQEFGSTTSDEETLDGTGDEPVSDPVPKLARICLKWLVMIGALGLALAAISYQVYHLLDVSHHLQGFGSLLTLWLTNLGISVENEAATAGLDEGSGLLASMASKHNWTELYDGSAVYQWVAEEMTGISKSLQEMQAETQNPTPKWRTISTFCAGNYVFEAVVGGADLPGSIFDELQARFGRPTNFRPVENTNQFPLGTQLTAYWNEETKDWELTVKMP